MEENNKEINRNTEKTNVKNPIVTNGLSELLCCSSNNHSENNEQLSSEEVALLWLRINQNL